jgi:hypothetical protein
VILTAGGASLTEVENFLSAGTAGRGGAGDGAFAGRDGLTASTHRL